MFSRDQQATDVVPADSKIRDVRAYVALLTNYCCIGAGLDSHRTQVWSYTLSEIKQAGKQRVKELGYKTMICRFGQINSSQSTQHSQFQTLKDRTQRRFHHGIWTSTL